MQVECAVLQRLKLFRRLQEVFVRVQEFVRSLLSVQQPIINPKQDLVIINYEDFSLKYYLEFHFRLSSRSLSSNLRLSSASPIR